MNITHDKIVNKLDTFLYYTVKSLFTDSTI